MGKEWGVFFLYRLPFHSFSFFLDFLFFNFVRVRSSSGDFMEFF